MGVIDTTFLRGRIVALEVSLRGVRQHRHDDVAYDMYRAACVKEFELVLAQSGKLLRKRLAAWFATNRQADGLHFKDLFRHAARHGLIDGDAVERWIRYRDNRSSSTLDHGEGFTESTLGMLPAFINDAKALAAVIEAADDG